MRWTLLAMSVIGCGGSAKPSTTPLPQDHAQVIDVAEAGPLPVGTRFTVTVHRTQTGGSIDFKATNDVKTQEATATVDATYSFHIIGEGQLEIAFTEGRETMGGTTTTWPMTGKTYLVDERGVAHKDGSLLDDAESAALSLFAQAGGLGLPVREALAGKKIDRETPLALDSKTIVELVLAGAPEDATGKATLRGVDADGIATLDVEAAGTMGAVSGGTWTLSGTIRLEAATLLPRSVEYEVTIGGYVDTGDGGFLSGSNKLTSKQTFTYD